MLVKKHIIRIGAIDEERTAIMAGSKYIESPTKKHFCSRFGIQLCYKNNIGLKILIYDPEIVYPFGGASRKIQDVVIHYHSSVLRPGNKGNT